MKGKMVKGKIISRILDKRALIIYLAACLMLFILAPGQKSVMNVLGGFSPQGSKGLDIIGIMRWNLCVLPPVAVSILFMDVEMGALRVYTLIRTKNAKRWFLPRFIAIAVANLSYLFLFTVLAEVYTGSGDYSRGSFYVLLTIFFLHSFMMSVISAALCAWSGGVHVSVIFFLAVEGIMVVIGDIFPRTAAYLLPYWGMIQQVGVTHDGSVLYLVLIIGVSAAMIIGAALLIIKCLRA